MNNWFVSQSSCNDCGVACLLMILKMNNIDAKRSDILKKANLKKEGVSAYDIIKISKSYNLSAVGYKGFDIEKIQKPVIAHVINDNNSQHFVIVLKVLKDKIKIADPNIGVVSINKGEFLKKYTGVIISFDFLNRLPIKSIYKNKKLIFKIIFTTIIWSLICVIYSYSLSISIKLLEENIDRKIIYIMLLMFILLGLLKELVSFLRNKLSIHFKLLIDELLSASLIDKLLSLPISFYQKHPEGELISKINDLSYVKEMISNMVEVVFINAVLLITIFVLSIFINVKFAAINLIFIMIMYLINKYFFKKVRYKNYDMQIKVENLNSSLIGSFTNIISIKNLVKEKHFINKNVNNYKNVINSSKQLYKSYIKRDLIINVLLIIFEVLILFVCILNDFDISNMVYIIGIESMLMNSSLNIFSSFGTYTDYVNAKNRINSVFEEKEINLNGNDLDIKSIEFKNLSYKYDDNIVLKNVNLSINKGDWIIVNGKTGSGKSTLFKLLSKEINTNNIFINNKRISTYGYADIKKNILYVDQKTKLFNDTIKNNITFGKDNYKKATKCALVDKLLKDNNLDYQYIVDNANNNLSGGAIQKILIAQALYNHKNVIILDETTSQLDVQTERKILTNIKKAYKNLTLILISHRNSNKDVFDKEIYVEGRSVYEKVKQK